MIDDVTDHINRHSLDMAQSFKMADKTILLGTNPQIKNPVKNYGIQN